VVVKTGINKRTRPVGSVNLKTNHVLHLRGQSHVRPMGTSGPWACNSAERHLFQDRKYNVRACAGILL